MKSECQVLRDVSSSGKIRKWAQYKLSNTYLAEAYEAVDNQKAERLRGCASFLEYKRDIEHNGRMKLVTANFCRVRLCPVCSWRRSLKIYGQMSQILIALNGEYSYIFLTLTIRNCEAYELSDHITWLSNSYNYLTRNIDFKRAVHGYFRAIEVTRNRATGQYHPHIHALLAVKRSYFNSRYYLPQEWWTHRWTECLSLNASALGISVPSYTPIVDVRKVRPRKTDVGDTGIMNAIAEVSKYAVKSADIICYDDWDLTIDTVRTLDKALAGRRLATMGGVIKKKHAELHLSAVDDDSDLLHITESDDITADDDSLLYVWHSGYSEYIRSN